MCAGQLLPNVFKSHAWGILHTLLEMFSYRMHHIQPHYRVQLLSHLHSLAAVPQTNQNQLHLWYWRGCRRRTHAHTHTHRLVLLLKKIAESLLHGL